MFPFSSGQWINRYKNEKKRNPQSKMCFLTWWLSFCSVLRRCWRVLNCLVQIFPRTFFSLLIYKLLWQKVIDMLRAKSFWQLWKLSSCDCDTTFFKYRSSRTSNTGNIAFLLPTPFLTYFWCLQVIQTLALLILVLFG